MSSIREATPADAAALLALKHALDGGTRFMLLEPGERTSSQADERAQLGAVRRPRRRRRAVGHGGGDPPARAHGHDRQRGRDRALRKMGYESEGTRRDALLVDGEFVDELWTAKLLDVPKLVGTG